jgi:arylsulfatase A-like enzyme
LLKEKGYATAQFGKNHGPRGVIHSFANGKIENTGPMTRKRMETADEEFLAGTLKFIDKAHKDKKPFFIWHSSTCMHLWTRLQEKYRGKSGVSLTGDGMLEHDEQVGILLDKLDDLKIADNTIVIYSTDNGAEKFSWPDGGTSPFVGEKGPTSEGGMRIPQLVRWPGTIKAGSKFNNMMSHEDWMPTILAATGEPNIVEKLKNGHKANGNKFRIHAEGHNFKPLFEGKEKASPPISKLYFNAAADLNAVRWNEYKIAFAVEDVGINTAYRKTPAWPVITNLHADPFETASTESGMYLRWYADNMWLFVPAQQQVSEFMSTIDGYPFQSGSSLSASDIGYKTILTRGAYELILGNCIYNEITSYLK